MYILNNEAGPKTVQLQPGTWKITVDIAGAGSVAFEEIDTHAGATARPVLDPSGAAYAITTPGASFTYIAHWGYLRATVTGGVATVRAEAVSGGV